MIEQARRQLEDLVPVWAVLDYTQAALVQRELLLAKVSVMGPEVYEEIMQHHREMTSSETDVREDETEENYDSRLQQLEEQGGAGSAGQGLITRAKAALGREEDYHPSRLAASQALRHKMEHLDHITHLTHQFGGKVLDISTNNCIVEV